MYSLFGLESIYKLRRQISKIPYDVYIDQNLFIKYRETIKYLVQSKLTSIYSQNMETNQRNTVCRLYGTSLFTKYGEISELLYADYIDQNLFTKYGEKSVKYLAQYKWTRLFIKYGEKIRHLVQLKWTKIYSQNTETNQ